MAVETLDQFRALRQVAKGSTVRRESANEIEFLFRSHVENRPINLSCPSCLWDAFKSLKDVYQRVRGEWENVERQEQAERDLQDYKSGE
jgi:hypothetical protein